MHPKTGIILSCSISSESVLFAKTKIILKETNTIFFFGGGGGMITCDPSISKYQKDILTADENYHAHNIFKGFFFFFNNLF